MHTRCRTTAVAAVACVLLAAPLTPARAQDDEPAYRQLVDALHRPYLTVGLLIQTVGDFQIDRTAIGHNGFTVTNARLKVSGRLDAGFGYRLQTDFSGAPAVLDAELSYRPGRAVGLAVGQFKAPFSGEVLTSVTALDFVNRAQAVTALAPGRQIGAEITLGPEDGPLSLTAGAFNGNPPGASVNDNDDLLYVARLAAGTSWNPEGTEERSLSVGASAALSHDEVVNIPNVVAGFNGDRALLGADARLVHGPLLLSGEVVYARLEPALGAVLEPWGFHATGGYRIGDRLQGLVRFDHFDPAVTATVDLVIVGFNAWPTAATKFQVNYVIDTDETAFENHRVLANFQIGF